MIQYPLSFFCQSQSQSGISSSWKTNSSNVESLCAIPPEFEGVGGGLSPEDLYAQALTNCFVGTFKVYAEKSGLSFENLQVNTELKVDLDEKKKPVMKSALLKIQISGGEKPERLKSLAERAIKAGFILNSVKTEIDYELAVS